MTTPSDLENLHEGQVHDGVALPQAVAGALNQTELITATPRPDGLWRVQAAHVVGAVRVGDLVVRVRPKIGTVQVLRLLARAHGVRRLRVDDTSVDLGVEPDLHAALAVLFADEATRAFVDGIPRGYRTEDQSLAVLRGRLRVRDQELRRFGQLTPLEVTVDEWTADTDDNRRVRAANDILLRLPGVPDSIRHQLLRLDRALTNVELAPAGHRPAPWTATRLNHRMHDLLRLTDLVLDQQTLEHRHGEVHARGFVVRMEKLFEDLVLRLFHELDDGTTVHGQTTYRLDTQHRITIKPDLVFRGDDRLVGVADTKYKFLDDTGRFTNADAYQLITYCARLGLPEGHLIYAAGPLPVTPFDIPTAGVRLVVHKVDLTATTADLEQQVANVRQRILALHQDPFLTRTSAASSR